MVSSENRLSLCLNSTDRGTMRAHLLLLCGGSRPPKHPRVCLRSSSKTLWRYPSTDPSESHGDRHSQPPCRSSAVMLVGIARGHVHLGHCANSRGAHLVGLANFIDEVVPERIIDDLPGSRELDSGYSRCKQKMLIIRAVCGSVNFKRHRFRDARTTHMRMHVATSQL